jgi:hypothetical protein
MNVSVVAGKPPIATPSANITWSPIAEGVNLSFAGSSFEEVRDALTTAFGPFPIRLSSGNHMLVLQGMVAAAGERKEPYRALLTALSRFGGLELNYS